DQLVAGDPPPESQHHVREQRIVRQERLPGQSPTRADRREGSPPMRRPQAGRAVSAQREAEVVPVREVVVGLAEEGQESTPPTGAGDVLRGRVTQGILDESLVQALVEEVRAVSGL